MEVRGRHQVAERLVGARGHAARLTVESGAWLQPSDHARTEHAISSLILKLVVILAYFVRPLILAL